jgi:hypothetical protein
MTYSRVLMNDDTGMPFGYFRGDRQSSRTTANDQNIGRSHGFQEIFQ